METIPFMSLDNSLSQNELQKMSQYEQPTKQKHHTKTFADHIGRWTKEEHDLFLEGLDKYGKDWKMISTLVKTRTVVQVRTHAQKYFQKLSKQNITFDIDSMPMQYPIQFNYQPQYYNPNQCVTLKHLPLIGPKPQYMSNTSTNENTSIQQSPISLCNPNLYSDSSYYLNIPPCPQNSCITTTTTTNNNNIDNTNTTNCDNYALPQYNIYQQQQDLLQQQQLQQHQQQQQQQMQLPLLSSQSSLLQTPSFIHDSPRESSFSQDFLNQNTWYDEFNDDYSDIFSSCPGYHLFFSTFFN